MFKVTKFDVSTIANLVFVHLQVVESLPNSEDSATVKTLECTQGFYRENESSACIPSCHNWTEYESTATIAIDVIVFIAALIGFLAAVAVLVISVVRRKRM